MGGKRGAAHRLPRALALARLRRFTPASQNAQAAHARFAGDRETGRVLTTEPELNKHPLLSKLLVIASLMLLLSVPLLMVLDTIQERSAYRSEAASEGKAGRGKGRRVALLATTRFIANLASAGDCVTAFPRHPSQNLRKKWL